MHLDPRTSLTASLLFCSLSFVTVGCGGDSDSKTAATSGASGASGTAGTAGTSAAGTAGTTAGEAGAAGTAGGAASAGAAGSGATGGDAGTAGDGGTGGDAGTAGESGSAGASATAGASGASTDYPAEHQAAPTAVNSGSASLVMTAPKVYPVYFGNDDTTVTGKLTEFFQGVGTFTVGDATYWSAVTSEYGVGPLSAGAPIQLTETSTGTVDDADIQTWLAAKFNANDPAFPVPDDNTIMALVYPANVTISLLGSSSCTEFGGYHQEIQLDAAHQSRTVSYAVLPRCPGDPFDTQLGVTVAASHELIEAATDPTPNLDPAYISVDTAHRVWARTLGGGEVGDLCAQNANAFTKFMGFGYPVQRSWSNVSAAASHDPCVPIPASEGSYFNSVPVLDDVTIMFGGGGGGGGQSAVIKAVQIPVGTTKTIDVQLFSDGPTDGPWKVKALDGQYILGQTPLLTFAFEDGVDSGVNGDTLHLSITMMTAPQHSTASFLLASSRGGQQNLWVGAVAK